MADLSSIVISNKRRFFVDFATRFLLSLLLIYATYDSYVSYFLSVSGVIFCFFFIILWPPVFKHPHKILVNETENIIIINFINRKERLPVSDLNNFSEINSKWCLFTLKNGQEIKVLSPFRLFKPALEKISFYNSKFTIQRVSLVKRFLHDAIDITLLLGGCYIILIILTPNLQSISYEGGYNSAASHDVRNAHTAAQAYFADHPNGVVTISILHSYGFKETPNISLDIKSGSRSSLLILSKYVSGNTEYMVDSAGNISYGKIDDDKWKAEVEERILEQTPK